MRKTAFNFFSNLSVISLKVIDSIYNTQGKLTKYIYTKVRQGFGTVGYKILKKIDPKKVRFYENYIDAVSEKEYNLESQQTELKLLGSAVTIRDHAIKTGDWTDNHSEALEAIGNNLLNSFDWDEESVHQYFKEVVEAVPGLDYGVEEE